MFAEAYTIAAGGNLSTHICQPTEEELMEVSGAIASMESALRKLLHRVDGSVELHLNMHMKCQL